MTLIKACCSILLLCLTILPAISSADEAVLRELRTLNRKLDGVQKQMVMAEKKILRQINEIHAQIRIIRRAQALLPQRNQAIVVKRHANKTPKTLLDEVRVCYSGCNFRDLNKAIAALKPGGLIKVAAEITGTCGVITKPLRLVGESSEKMTRPHFVGGICHGKGPIVIESENVTIENIEISGVTVRSENGACIRIGPKADHVTISKVYCHDSQTGILAKMNGSLLIEKSRFERNGNKGRAHGLYIELTGKLVIREVQVLSTKSAGHTLKLNAPHMLIENSIIAALNGHNSRAFDVYGGGDLVVRNSVIQQGPKSENTDMFGIALEPKRILPGPHSVLLENNWLIFDHTEKGLFINGPAWKLFRGRNLGKIVVENNRIVGMQEVNMKGAVMRNNRLYKNRQEARLNAFDGTTQSLSPDMH